MQAVSILGVKINNISLKDARQKVREFLNSTKQYKIFTPNPEMIVKAQKDEYFKYSLNQGDLNLCDGRGIQLVSKEKIERIAGVDFMLAICRIAEEEGRGVYLLGSGSDGVVNKTAENLHKQFPQLKILGFEKGPFIHENIKTLKHKNKLQRGSELIVEEAENNRTIEKINQLKPAILFVAFGMGKQEKWIIENLSKMPSVKIVMGVGGAFDYISGKVKRAPLLLRKLGLEWLCRLVRQPKRGFRIWNATVGFFYINIKFTLKRKTNFR